MREKAAQDRAGVLRQERSGERRAAAHEADPGGLHGPARGRRFFLIRFGAFVVVAIVAFSPAMDGERGSDHLTRWTFVVMAGGAGYFLPGFVLGRLVAPRCASTATASPISWT